MSNEGRRRVDQMVAHQKVSREAGLDRYKARSRERLKNIAATKMRTAMIGSLSLIEEILGFVWGQGRPKGALTRRELEMDELREDLRIAILDLGNAQMRALMKEIDQYTVSWDRFHCDFNVKD